jgi:hypothetical protein
MSQPVKISDELILDARRTAEVARRSIAGQIEYWAQLGRAIEPLLEGAQALALCRAGTARPLSECLASVDSPAGRKRVADYLESGPFPHYRPVPDSRGLVTRIGEDGTQTVGRFVGREFHAESIVKGQKPPAAGTSASFEVLTDEIRRLGLNKKLEKKRG